MSVLGDVTVAVTTVVKVLAWVGMAASAIPLAGDAFAMLIPDAAFGGAFVNSSAEQVGRNALIFAAGFTGFQIAKWVDGKARDIDADERDAEMERWQAAHGMNR